MSDQKIPMVNTGNAVRLIVDLLEPPRCYCDVDTDYLGAKVARTGICGDDSYRWTPDTPTIYDDVQVMHLHDLAGHA